MVTEVPTGPEVGDRLVMLGRAVAVKLTALLASAAALTTTLPVAAPLGTGATMLVALQLVGVAAVPLKLTVLRSGDRRVGVPGRVTEVPTGPEVSDRMVVVGSVVRGQRTSLMGRPGTVTTTL